MPPREFSRFSNVEAVRAPGETALWLAPRRPLRFRDEPDVRVHVAREGDTWHNLAARYFPSFPRPAGLWWALVDFQPTPVVDPTLELAEGTEVYVPPERLVQAYLAGELDEEAGGA